MVDDAGLTRLREHRARLLTGLACGFVLVVGFEPVLYLIAVLLFPHLDTPECAGADTFCSPNGHPGLTGGAVVVLAGNLIAVALLVVLLVRFRLSSRRGSSRV